MVNHLSRDSDENWAEMSILTCGHFVSLLYINYLTFKRKLNDYQAVDVKLFELQSDNLESHCNKGKLRSNIFEEYLPCQITWLLYFSLIT